MKLLVRLSSLAFLSLIAACSDSTPTPAGRVACEEIVERCHPLDQGTGDIHECHEFAEATATTNAQCLARRAACLATCTAADAGADASADVTSDVASDVSADVTEHDH